MTKSNKEEILAQCYLRYKKGNADPRHHAYLTKSKIYIRKNSDNYEMYSLKDIIGIRMTNSYIWILIILGILFVFSGLANKKYELIPSEKPQLQVMNYHRPLDENTRLQSLDLIRAQNNWDTQFAKSNSEYKNALEQWEYSNENWTYGLIIWGIILFLMGLKKQSSLRLLMNKTDLQFRVYIITNEYLNFIQILQSRVGFIPKE